MTSSRLWRAAPHMWGLAGVAVLVWAVLSSIGGFPGYSVWTHFVSQLADSLNPRASRFDAGLLAGGALVAAACALQVWRAPDAPRRVAAGAGAAAAACISLLGVFPIARPVPHFTLACLAGLLSFVACVAAARAALRAGSRPVAVAMIAFVVLSIGAGLVLAVHLARVVTGQDPGSLAELLRLPPDAIYVSIAGARVNPFAVVEWWYFASVTAIYAASCARGVRDALAPARELSATRQTTPGD